MGKSGDWKAEGYKIEVLNPEKDSKHPLFLTHIKEFMDTGIDLLNVETEETIPLRGNRQQVEDLKAGKLKIDSSGYGMIAMCFTRSGNLVGMVTTEDIGTVLKSWVRQAHRRKGIASAMYEAIGATPSGSQSSDAVELWKSMK